MPVQPIVGLDIGTSRIKFVEARLGKGGILISNAGIGLTPRDAIANGVIVDPDVLSSAVRQLLDQHGCKTKAVISSVASQSSLVVRPIEVPRMTRQELAQTMQWEVERHIPFAASEVVMDFQPLVDPDQLPPDVQNMDVLLAVAQEALSHAHLAPLCRAGLDPQAVDVEPLSACRALVDINRDLGAYERSQALLSIGATTTDLSIIRQGLLSFTRPVPLAGDNITNAIAEALGYEFHEAERVKLEEARLYLDGSPALQAPGAPAPPQAEPEARRAGAEEEEAPTRVFDLGEESRRPTTPPPPQEPASALPSLRAPGLGSPARQVYDAMLPTVVELVQEVRRSVEYYVNRFPDSRVDGVLLFGGTARLPNLPEFLGNEIAIPVEVGNPFLRLEMDSGIAEEIVASACMMTVAAGLAMRDLLT